MIPEVRIADLRGQWRFRVGDDIAYAAREYDARRWATIFVPAAWEDEGYPGLDGTHWYRLNVTLPASIPAGDVYLDLGRIDDSDETYFNGTLIGKNGGFPPEYSTAYHQFRSYRIPTSLIRRGAENVIAVRVYDDKLNGGILEGRPGIVVRQDPNRVADLSGIWQFQTGDRPERSRVDVDDSRWYSLTVPGAWDNQGFGEYDGFGWYRHRFRIESVAASEGLWMVLGKIDDADEVWLNGVFLGATGSMNRTAYTSGDVQSDWRKIRYYRIPPGLLKTQGENVIAVRVLDTQLGGGIYDGPVGIYRNIDRFVRANAQLGPEQTYYQGSWWQWFLNW
jgi:sialate O-acetylesterase